MQATPNIKGRQAEGRISETVGLLAKKVKLFRWLRYKYLLFIRIKDQPNKIAAGAALGVSFDVLPTFGLGVVAAFFIARLIRVNSLAAVISAVLFKLAIPFFIYINFKTGSLFINDPPQLNGELLSRAELMASPWFNFDWSRLGRSFILGSVINAAVCFGLVYLTVYFFVKWRRARQRRV